MNKIKHYIDTIVENEEPEQMKELSEMLIELLEKSDHKDEYKMKLYGMAHNYKFDEEMAKELVEEMKPLGEHWSIETTSSLYSRFPLDDIDKVDFYIVMNSLANDYNKVIDLNNVDLYVKMAKAFIEDEDAKDCKVWKYFNTIPKN